MLAVGAIALVGLPAPAASAAHRLSDGSRSQRLIVTFRPHASAHARQAALANAGVTTVKRIARLNMVVVRGSSAAEDVLSRDSAVAFSEADRTVHAAATPNDPLFSATANPCGSSFGCWPYATLRLPQAWDSSTGSAATVVAVVDTGVNASHPDLAQGVLPGYNVLAGNTNATDDNGHGTMVAGVIAARQNNGIGIPGVCGSCSILPVKVLNASGSGSTSGVAQGVQWAADHGARVINLSLAGTAADPALKSAIVYANSKGALVVAAAGNSGSADPAAGSTGGYPGAFTSSIASGLVSVAGVDASNALYSWSNHGPWVTVAAPGAATVTTKDGAYAVAFGTSIAAPFVSGVAGLAVSVAPNLSVAALQNALTSTVTRVAGLDDATGGVVNAAAVLQSLGGASAPTAPASTTPASAAAPAISGTARVGHTLSASAGSWSGTGPLAYRYQWQSSRDRTIWTNVAGATTAGYTPSAAAVGTYLRVTVTATNTAASAASTSASTDRVAYDAPSIKTAPVVSGSLTVGSVLSASPGTWNNVPTGYAYQWQYSTDAVAWLSIGGAVRPQLTVGSDYVGRYLRVTVTAVNSSGSGAASSAPTAQVRPLAPSVVTVPALSGTARAGGTLNASAGTWRGTGPLTTTYQWQLSSNGATWTTVAGAEPHFTVPASAQKAYVRVGVTVTNAAGAASAYSAAVRIAG